MMDSWTSAVGGPYRAPMPRVDEPPREVPWHVRGSVLFGSSTSVLSWAVLGISGAEGALASAGVMPKQRANAIELEAQLKHARCGTLASALEWQYAPPSPLSFSTLGLVLVVCALPRGMRACRLLSSGRVVWAHRRRAGPSDAKEIEYEADGVRYVMTARDPGWVIYRVGSGSRAYLLDRLPARPEIDADGRVRRANPLRALVVLMLALIVFARCAAWYEIEAQEVRDNPPETGRRL
jgi:hypothetical protein